MDPINSSQSVQRPLTEWSIKEQAGLVVLVALVAISLAATATLLILNRAHIKPTLSSIPFVASVSTSFTTLVALIAFSILFSRKKEPPLLEEKAITKEKNTEIQTPKPEPVEEDEEEIFYTPPSTPRSTSPNRLPKEPTPSEVGYLSVEAMDVQRAAFTEALQNAQSHAEARDIFKTMIVVPAAKSTINFLTTLTEQVYKLGEDMPSALKNKKVKKEWIQNGIQSLENKMCNAIMAYLEKQKGAAMEKHFEKCLAAEVKKNTNLWGTCSLTNEQKIKIRAHYKKWRELSKNEDDLNTYKKMLVETITPTHELFGFLIYIAAKLKYSDWGKQVAGTGLKLAQAFNRCIDKLDDVEYEKVSENFKATKLDRYYPFFSAGDSQFHILWADILRVLFVPFLTLVKPNGPAQRKLKEDFWQTLVSEGVPTTDKAIKPDTCYQTDFFRLMLLITKKYQN